MNDKNITLLKIATTLFHNKYRVSIDDISDSTLIITSGNDYLSFNNKENILFIQDKFLYRENIVNANLKSIYTQDWFKHNIKFNTRLFKRVDITLFNKSTNIHTKIFSDVLEDKEITLHQKYLYNIVLGTLDIYKYAGLIKQSSLSIDKERIYTVLNSLNYGRITRKEFQANMKKFQLTKFVKNFNDTKIELVSTTKLYNEDTIYHAMTLKKNKNFTAIDFKKIAIELLFASPTFKNDSNSELEFTTTLKKVANCMGLKPCSINYHTRDFLKMIKFQFISAAEYKNIKKMQEIEKGAPYTFKVYTNQKTLWNDENGEFKNNDEYYLTPIGSKLYTNKKFSSFNRTGEKYGIKYLSFKEDISSQKSFVNLTNEFNLVRLLDIVERKRQSPENIFNDSLETSNAFQIDESSQIQFVYKNYSTVKNELQQLIAIIGMIKNLSSCDINICSFDWNQKRHSLLRRIRFFARRMLELDIDEELLRKNLNTFGLIIDKTLSSKNSKRHINKHKDNVKKRELANRRYMNEVVDKFTHEFSNKLTNETFSSFFNKENKKSLNQVHDILVLPVLNNISSINKWTTVKENNKDIKEEIFITTARSCNKKSIALAQY